MIQKTLILSTLILTAYAQNISNKDSDGTLYKAPRLAGDSLSIKEHDDFETDKNYNSLQDAFTNTKIKAHLTGKYIGENKSMPMAGAIFTQDSFSLEAWNYYVYDFVNTFYCYGDYNFNISKSTNLSLAAQYGNQIDVGDAVAGSVDTYFMDSKRNSQ